MPRDNNNTELGSSNQEASPSAGTNTGMILVSCHAWKCVTKAISSGVDRYFLGPLVSLVTTDEFSVRVTKIYF